ncbi:hypothetical protein [Flavobacterium sp.]|jgi:hypothetical protein|uniref:hypothetical protein n=1 Tax=Flavobacterium TaxID=237 RepID=UPI0022BE43A3|nr:hypothetical protein [Flavobacterium sp.]MCZ8089748.1 hypothetical protein [Flavobacterium sp.]
MKKTILIIGLLFLSISNFAQDKNTILGKWTYKDVYQKESQEQENLEITMMMFKDFTLDFKEKEVILTLMGKSEAAQWSFDESDPKIINTVSKTGKKAKLVIIKFDEKEMVIELGKTPFILSKS